MNHFTSAKAETQRHTSPTHLLRNKIEKRKNYIHLCRKEKGIRRAKRKKKKKERKESIGEIKKRKGKKRTRIKNKKKD